MKRGKRPFTVEVRRAGPKRPGFPEADTGGMSLDPEVLRRAEEALGQGRGDIPPSAPLEAERPKGRILPNLTEPPPEVPMAEEIPAPRRRGRPPGSKNKPKVLGAQPQVAGAPKRRGRPPKIRPEPVVRPSWFTPPAVQSPAKAARGLPTEPPEATTTAELVRLPRMERRMSTILGRWVYGTVPTRGERWKRRLR
jgi:hypothetical protein